MSDSITRVNVTFENFLKAVMDREQYPDQSTAATELGMTESSFRQRLTRERKDFPDIFAAIPSYPKNGGRKKTTAEQAQAIFAKLGGTLPEAPTNESE